MIALAYINKAQAYLRLGAPAKYLCRRTKKPAVHVISLAY